MLPSDSRRQAVPTAYHVCVLSSQCSSLTFPCAHDDYDDHSQRASCILLFARDENRHPVS